eukprot:scaffold119109_cov68-Phaeocystis_antarctica.AAC.7
MACTRQSAACRDGRVESSCAEPSNAMAVIVAATCKSIDGELAADASEEPTSTNDRGERRALGETAGSQCTSYM